MTLDRYGHPDAGYAEGSGRIVVAVLGKPSWPPLVDDTGSLPPVKGAGSLLDASSIQSSVGRCMPSDIGSYFGGEGAETAGPCSGCR